MQQNDSPKILVVDIETAPVLASVWGLWDQNIGLNQIKSDWFILAWSAKWLGDPASKIMYKDQRKAKDIENDSKIMKDLWRLLDEADVILTQNGKAFDEKKINARFILNGITPPSPYKHIDTRQIARKRFGFTSNKLEYMTDKLCTKFKKLKHKRYPGQELWTECLKGNLTAWKEMERYNKYDVLSLEELYNKFKPWDNTVNLHLYSKDNTIKCDCGDSKLVKNGSKRLLSGTYQTYRCVNCGSIHRSKKPINKSVNQLVKL